MSSQVLIRRWPRAIAHVDGDAFFASVEQAVKPYLRGKPVVTGKERNIVAAASYEAKRFGVKRGVTLWDAKKMCPGLIVLPTDYETVSIFSKRMHDIMRRYSPSIEEYSVDEGFVDLTGLRRLHHAGYETIARNLQQNICNELGITVTVGLSVSKVLTKIASKKGKPAGFISINAREIDAFLADVPVEDIWNIGPNTAALLKHHGLCTAQQFARASEEFIARTLSKPGRDVWYELNGESVIPLSTTPKEHYQSISKTKTFTPSSGNRDYIFAQLMKNVENACIKARRYHQAPQNIIVFLKQKNYRTCGSEAILDVPSAYPSQLAPAVHKLFTTLIQPETLYRATGVVFTNLTASDSVQPRLFDNPATIRRMRSLYEALDELRERFGKHVVHHAASLPAHALQHLTARGDLPIRKTALLVGESKRRRLPIPFLQTPAQ